MTRKLNIWIIVITLILYTINQCTKEKICNEAISLFMCGYFNDIVGSITFMAYVNALLEFKQLSINKLWQISLIMLICSFFWEIITPLFRTSTVADFWDAVAYLIGGFFYWLILKFYHKRRRNL